MANQRDQSPFIPLDPNMNLAVVLATDRTATTGEVKAWFFRTARVAPIHLVYDSELPLLAPGAIRAAAFIGVTSLGIGEDLLRIPEEMPFRIHHYAIGMRPPGVWLYRQYAGTLQSSLQPQVEHAIGNKFDFIDGYLSPYDAPSAIARDTIVEGVGIRYGFRNDAATSIRPSLRFIGAAYDVLPITDNEFINKLIAGIIPCTFEILGGLRTFTFTKPDAWVKETIISQERLNEAIGRIAVRR